MSSIRRLLSRAQQPDKQQVIRVIHINRCTASSGPCIVLKQTEGGDIMNMATVLGVLALAVILFFAARYIYKEKKKGNQCIGCPYADSCTKHKGGGCGA